MLGEFIDDYTVQCVDVFAMPQSGTSVSVESVDPVFQQQMLEMLKQTGRWAGPGAVRGLGGGRVRAVRGSCEGCVRAVWGLCEGRVRAV